MVTKPVHVVVISLAFALFGAVTQVSAQAASGGDSAADSASNATNNSANQASVNTGNNVFDFSGATSEKSNTLLPVFTECSGLAQFCGWSVPWHICFGGWVAARIWHKRRQVDRRRSLSAQKLGSDADRCIAEYGSRRCRDYAALGIRSDARRQIPCGSV